MVAADARRRPPGSPSKTLFGGYFVDTSVRCPMERFTKIVPFVCDMLAKIINLVEVGDLPESLAALSPRIGWTR